MDSIFSLVPGRAFDGFSIKSDDSVVRKLKSNKNVSYPLDEDLAEFIRINSGKNTVKCDGNRDPTGERQIPAKPFSLVLANSLMAFQSSAPQSMAQTEMNMISAKIWVVFLGSRGSVSMLNFENRAFADIGATETDKSAILTVFSAAVCSKNVHVFAVAWQLSTRLCHKSQADAFDVPV